jgi:hypothetical protein
MRIRLRVSGHGGFAQLLRVHLAEALEAADFDLLALEHGRFQFGAVRIVAGVGALLAGGQAVERGLGEEQVAARTMSGISWKKKVISSVAICAPSTSASVMMMMRS